MKFQQEGAIRTFYFSILISHIILAAFVGVMAPITLFRALRERFPSHAKIARITFPIWVYVSITGVIVYIMLYQL